MSDRAGGAWSLAVIAACVAAAAIMDLAGPLAPAGPESMAHETGFVVYPSDINHMGTLFGGKILAEMDRASGIAVRRCLYRSPVKEAVTVSVDKVTFRRPAKVGDLVYVRGEVVAAGVKSLTVAVTASREAADGTREILADGSFTFVAYDRAKGAAAAHGVKIP